MIKIAIDAPNQIPDIETIVHKNMTKNVDQLKLSLDGEISDEQGETIRVIKAIMKPLFFVKMI